MKDTSTDARRTKENWDFMYGLDWYRNRRCRRHRAFECTLTGRAGLRAAVHIAERKRRAGRRAVLEL
jgi:hypothetical protein